VTGDRITADLQTCRPGRGVVRHARPFIRPMCAGEIGAVLSMQVRDVEGVAIHNGPESCVGGGNPDRRSVDRGTGRPGIQPRKNPATSKEVVPPGCRRRKERRKATSGASPARDAPGPRAVRDPEHARKHDAREPGDPSFACPAGLGRPHREV
jgi:hypothetical protein